VYSGGRADGAAALEGSSMAEDGSGGAFDVEAAVVLVLRPHRDWTRGAAFEEETGSLLPADDSGGGRGDRLGRTGGGGDGGRAFDEEEDAGGD
jgi:hypothetical protein